MEIEEIKIEGDSYQEREETSPSVENPSEIKSVGENGNIEIVKSNKNLLKLEFSNEVNTFSGLEFKHTNSTFELEGTVITSTYRIFNLTNIPKVNRGQNYSLSVNLRGKVPKIQITIYCYDSENNQIFKTSIRKDQTTETYKNTVKFNNDFNNISKATFVIEALEINAYYDLTAEVQLEENINATEYEEHKGEKIILPVQQPLRRIGNVADTFIKKEGKMYERHNIERIEEYNNEIITTEYISTTGELTEGATVDYILDEPKDLECTQEQNQALEKINELRTYKNETIIYSRDEVSPIIEIKYKKDIETMLNNVTEAIIATGGV